MDNSDKYVNFDPSHNHPDPYKILFYSALAFLLVTNFFLIYKNNLDIKKIKSEKALCPVITCPAKLPPAPTPTLSPIDTGIAADKCPSGYKCVKLPTPVYTCPKSVWVNCMPSPDQPQNYQCQTPFLEWAKANCPNFKGAAL